MGLELAIDPEVAGLFVQPDYYERLRRLRASSPVHEYRPGSWVVTRYDDVRAVSRDPQRFCSGRGVLMSDPVRSGGTLPGSVLHMDPPEHAKWRRLAARWFTPRAMTRLEQRVRELTRSLLDAVPPGETVDLVDALAAPLPVQVIAELLGIDDGDRDDFRRWSDAAIELGEHIDSGGAPDDAPVVAVMELHAYLLEQVRARRAAPSDDLLSVLVGSDVDGSPVGDSEAVMYAMSLLVAGNETTRHLLSGALLALFEHPDQRQALADGPSASRIAGAVEELIRWVTPIQAFGRTATEDVSLGGAAIGAGDWVVLLYASANRDESAFGPTAGRFDTTRSASPSHVAFGFGEHLCLGASLARLEARVFLEELLAGSHARPDYAIVGEPGWVTSTLVRGMSTLPGVLP